MVNAYLMTLKSFCLGLEVLINNPQLSEKEKRELMKIVIDQSLDREYKS